MATPQHVDWETSGNFKHGSLCTHHVDCEIIASLCYCEVWVVKTEQGEWEGKLREVGTFQLYRVAILVSLGHKVDSVVCFDLLAELITGRSYTADLLALGNVTHCLWIRGPKI